MVPWYGLSFYYITRLPEYTNSTRAWPIGLEMYHRTKGTSNWRKFNKLVEQNCFEIRVFWKEMAAFKKLFKVTLKGQQIGHGLLKQDFSWFLPWNWCPETVPLLHSIAPKVFFFFSFFLSLARLHKCKIGQYFSPNCVRFYHCSRQNFFLALKGGKSRGETNLVAII